MTNSSQSSPRAAGLGLLLVLAGLSINPWTIGWAFAPDGHIQGVAKIGAICAAGLLVVCVGFLLFAGRLRIRSQGLRGVLALGAVLLMALIGWRSRGQFGEQAAEVDEQLALLHDIDKSEDLIQWLTTEIRHLNKSALNLDFPDHKAKPLFGATIHYAGLDPAGNSTPPEDFLAAGAEHLPLLSELLPTKFEDLHIWPSLFDKVEYFDHAKFYIVRGHFLNEARLRFETDMGFAALAKLKTGHFAYISGSMDVAWHNYTPEGAEDPL